MGKTAEAQETTIGDAPGPKSAGQLKHTNGKVPRVRGYKIKPFVVGEAMRNWWDDKADAVEDAAEHFCGDGKYRADRDYNPKPAPFRAKDSFKECWRHFENPDNFEVTLEPHEIDRQEKVVDILVEPYILPDTKAQKIRDLYACDGKTGTLPGDIEGQEGPATMDKLMTACHLYHEWDISYEEEVALREILLANVEDVYEDQ